MYTPVRTIGGFDLSGTHSWAYIPSRLIQIRPNRLPDKFHKCEGSATKYSTGLIVQLIEPDGLIRIDRAG